MFVGFLLFFLFFCINPMLVRAADYSAITPGTSLFGRNKYIEYIKGNLPIVISVPHGGTLSPVEIPDHRGIKTADQYTQETARSIVSAVHRTTGRYPHVIINRLDRAKLDANRDRNIGDIAFAPGSVLAGQAWDDFHGYIEYAELWSRVNFGFAYYIDLHGQSVLPEKIMLGYVLSGADLRLSDQILSDPAKKYIEKSSLQALHKRQEQTAAFSDFLRGKRSFGYFLEKHGQESFPSLSQSAPAPLQIYFNGDYNLRAHTNSADTSGVQLEVDRDARIYCKSLFQCDRNDSGINNFSQALSLSLLDYYKANYGLDLSRL